MAPELLLAAATAGLLEARRRGLVGRRRELLLLAIVAALSAGAYLDFFAFHGGGRFVHYHDMAHYYLGSKYFGELGYGGLYTAMVRAEAELEGGVEATTARDLETYRPVPVRRLLRRSDPVKAAFTAERWADFQRDVTLFRRALGPRYGDVLLDHGFNPTPVWALLGSTVSRFMEPGSPQALRSLALLDPLLAAALLTAVGSAFGRRTLLLAVIYFCVLFGAGFTWVGGAFLRYPWLFAVVTGACCLKTRRPGLAGALFAAAAMLRVFPLLLVAPLAAKALSLARRRRALPPRYRAFFAAFTVTAAALFLATALLPRGFRHWTDFAANASLHAATLSSNFVGLSEVLAYRGDALASGQGRMTAATYRAIQDRRRSVHRLVLALVFLPLAVTVARLSRWQTDLGALSLGVPLIFVGLSLSAYYYVFLLALILLYRRSPRRLALLFAVEAAAHACPLVDDRQVFVFWVCRGLLIAVLCLALLAPRLRRERRLARLLAAG